VILVTGAKGFIGQHLCQALPSIGWDLPQQDIRYESTRPWVEGIVNLACHASPKRYQADPIGTLLTNVLGTQNLLEFADAAKVWFVQASTSEVYGDPQTETQSETDWGHVNPIGPRACYDEGKRCAETLCYDYQRMRGVDVRVARIFNTYGPGMDCDDGRVIPNFIVQALRGEPLTVYGDGSQTRSFCYISDLVEGLRLLCAGPVNGPLNLGNPAPLSMLELACLVKDLTGSASKIVHRPLPVDDPKQRKPDIRKAQSLGWSPKVSLKEGILKTVEYFDRQQAA
jgi:UDP-glucuronate decarboxylase